MLIETDFTESVVLPSRSGPVKEMLSVIDTDTWTKVRINSSSLSIIQECPRKAKYLLHDKWRGSVESPAQLFGSAIHKGLEVFYTGRYEDRKMPSLETMELMSFGHKVDGENEDLLLKATRAFIDKAQPLQQVPETDKRSIQNGVWLLYNYFKTYINDPYVAYSDDSGPFVERPFSFILWTEPSLQIEYFGTIDLIVKNLDTGNIVVCDHKTTSVVGSDFFNRLKPNHQYTGYLMGADSCFNIRTDSFMVNCLQVKEKPKTARGTPPHFPRQITTRDNADKCEFIEAVVYNVKSYLNMRDRSQWPLGHVNTCATYGGCGFLNVCSVPPAVRNSILQNRFVKGE